MSKANLLLGLTMLFFSGNWLLDVGHVVVFSNDGYGELTNGFWRFSAMQTYHFGWYLSVVCFILLAFLYLREIK